MIAAAHSGENGFGVEGDIQLRKEEMRQTQDKYYNGVQPRATSPRKRGWLRWLLVLAFY